MRQLLYLLTTVLFFTSSGFLAIHETISISQAFELNSLQKEFDENLGSISSPAKVKQTQSKVEQLLKNENKKWLWLFNHEKLALQARATVALAFATKDFPEQSKKLCEAKGLFQEALLQKPRDVPYLLGKVDLDAVGPIIGQSCEANSKDRLLNVNQSLMRIAQIAPKDPATQYRIGLIHRSQGRDNRLDAMRAFRKSEELSINSMSNMRDFLLRQPQNSQELEELLPRQLPRLIWWYQDAVRMWPTSTFYIEPFDHVITSTLENLDALVSEKNLSTEEYKKTLEQVFTSPNLSQLPKTKRACATSLLQLTTSKGDQTLFKLLSTVANEDKKEIAYSQSISSNSRSQGMVYKWETPKALQYSSLSTSHSTLGIYLPKENHAKILMIQGQEHQYCPIDLRIRTWSSKDNQRYSEINAQDKVDCSLIARTPFLLIPLPQVRGPYLKLFFTGTNNQHQVISSSSIDFLQTY